jgi:hypothetical protein
MRKRRCRDSSLGFIEREREGKAAAEAMGKDRPLMAVAVSI